MPEITPVSIEEQIVNVINLDAQTVAEVAPVAAQVAADFANLGMPEQSPFDQWLRVIPAFREKFIKYGLSVRLATYLTQYENTNKTATQVLQEIIDENTL